MRPPVCVLGVGEVPPSGSDTGIAGERCPALPSDCLPPPIWPTGALQAEAWALHPADNKARCSKSRGQKTRFVTNLTLHRLGGNIAGPKNPCQGTIKCPRVSPAEWADSAPEWYARSLPEGECASITTFLALFWPRSPMLLHATSYPSPAESALPLVLLHGFLGSGGNLHSLARRFSHARPVLVPDARNHGRSPHAATHTYPDLAADVRALLDAHGLAQAAVLGHSMGGKTAMHLALSQPERVARLIVVDAAPGRSPSAHADVLAALAAVDLDRARDRPEVEAALAARLDDAGLRGWLLKSLLRTPEGGFRWALNVPVLAGAAGDVGGPLEPTLPPAWRPYTGPALFVRGGRSRYVTDDRPAGDRAPVSRRRGRHHSRCRALGPRRAARRPLRQRWRPFSAEPTRVPPLTPAAPPPVRPAPRAAPGPGRPAGSRPGPPPAPPAQGRTTAQTRPRRAGACA